MKNFIFSSYRRMGDWAFIFLFALLDCGLIFLANGYLKSLNELASSSSMSVPSAQDLEAFKELEKLALSSNWDDFEKVRLEKVSHYLQSNRTPPLNYALYFYPEALPARSLEKAFAMTELKPSLEALRIAHKTQEKKRAELAYRRLKSRVENYELGLSTDSANLSEEAQTFLKIYSELTKIDEFTKIHEH